MKSKILIIILIFLCLMFVFGCEKRYETSEEVFDINYSGNIEDLQFCDIYIINNQTNEYIWFAFIGFENIKECNKIREDCERKGCEWFIRTSASGNSRGWIPKYSGFCYCRI